jgi:hypothetical protein
MTIGRYDLNKLSNKIIIHKTMDLIFIYKFLSLIVNFSKLDFLKII